jgi:hypothetical protein
MKRVHDFVCRVFCIKFLIYFYLIGHRNSDLQSLLTNSMELRSSWETDNHPDFLLLMKLRVHYRDHKISQLELNTEVELEAVHTPTAYFYSFTLLL